MNVVDATHQIESRRFLMDSQKVNESSASRMGAGTPFSLHRKNSAARARRAGHGARRSRKEHLIEIACFSNTSRSVLHARPNDLRRLQTSFRCSIKRRTRPHAQARKYPKIGGTATFCESIIFPLLSVYGIQNKGIIRLTRFSFFSEAEASHDGIVQLRSKSSNGDGIPGGMNTVRQEDDPDPTRHIHPERCAGKTQMPDASR